MWSKENLDQRTLEPPKSQTLCFNHPREKHKLDKLFYRSLQPQRKPSGNFLTQPVAATTSRLFFSPFLSLCLSLSSIILSTISFNPISRGVLLSCLNGLRSNNKKTWTKRIIQKKSNKAFKQIYKKVRYMTKKLPLLDLSPARPSRRNVLENKVHSVYPFYQTATKPTQWLCWVWSDHREIMENLNVIYGQAVTSANSTVFVPFLLFTFYELLYKLSLHYCSKLIL